ncbi:MAG: c-type cytochrome [Acidobacteria bacterium]|nr:c-type cytochrome [Acidobacteriota bacterium]
MLSLKYRIAFHVALAVAASSNAWAQPPGQAPRRQGGFVPGQQRAEEDPAKVSKGKGIYGISCRGCHGADLRGGDMGGPNLLRSQLSLSDREGEKIVPVIQGSLQSGGMPAIPMSPEDARAVAAYVRSVLSTIGGQGKPPSAQEPPTILVGNAEAGKVYFEAKCSSCHSATGDLKRIATRIKDPKVLQNTWVAGGGRAGRGAASESPRRVVTVTVKPANGGAAVQGRLVRIDDFVVTLELADGSIRSFRRDGDVPKVEVNDPLTPHRELLSVYADKDVHNVTAYLVTLK